MRNKSRLVLAVRIIATGIGILIGVFFVVFMIGEGGHPPLFSFRIEALMTWCLVIYMMGILVSIKSVGIGGLMTAFGIAGFYLINYASAGKFPGGPVFRQCGFPQYS
ncbi:MAG TPA: hypothetical protein ENN65_08790 [Candidatus Hydrogenedentes bacterium]|nr:hypothetical protein [Candidatus Hydrogenedentota bacterium]